MNEQRDKMRIYLDRHQSEKFNVEYYGDGKLLVAADVLLDSKIQEYDKEHRALLEPIGKGSLLMKRALDVGPGWWDAERADSRTDEQLCIHCPDQAVVACDREEVLLIGRCIHCNQKIECLVLAKDWNVVEEGK